MKTIDAVIKQVDTHNIYTEMVNFIQEVSRLGDMSGDQASTYETKYHLMGAKLTKLVADIEQLVVVLKRKKEDKLGDLKAVSEEKSESGKERDAKCDEAYRKIADDFAIAEVAFNKISNYKKFFNDGVYTSRSRQANQKRDWHSTPTNEV